VKAGPLHCPDGGIDFLKPTLFRNGHVHFATAADPRGLTSTGRGNRMAARNPHAIMFTWYASADEKLASWVQQLDAVYALTW
jgi:hypothetical protein